MEETPLRPIVYSLQFRGRITSLSSRVLEQRATAPGQVLITTVDADGVAGRVQPGRGEEALLVSRLVLADDGSFDQSGTIEFAPGHVLAFRSVGAARLGRSPDPHLRHGAAVWEVEGGRRSVPRRLWTHHVELLRVGHQRTDRQPTRADLRRTRRGKARSRCKNPRSAATPRHPRGLGPVSSLERFRGSPRGMRPLDVANGPDSRPTRTPTARRNSPSAQRYGKTSRSTTCPAAPQTPSSATRPTSPTACSDGLYRKGETDVCFM
jgi:hypothetical protein